MKVSYSEAPSTASNATTICSENNIAPTKSELNTFFKQFSDTKTKSVVFSLVPEYSDA